MATDVFAKPKPLGLAEAANLMLVGTAAAETELRRRPFNERSVA